MDHWYLLLLIIPLAAFVLFLRSDANKAVEEAEDEPSKEAGDKGERVVSEAIRTVLHRDDVHLTNVCIQHNGDDAELDNLVINRFGVFIIEAKNYRGRLSGKADDYSWSQTKKSESGKTYENSVKNPIRQVQRQASILARYLRSRGLDVWVDGFVYLLRGNCPIDSDHVLNSYSGIDYAIHTEGRKPLSREAVEHIRELLETEKQ